MRGGVDKRNPEPAERKKSVLTEIAAIERSCSASLNYTQPLQTLHAGKEKRKKV